MVTNVTAEEKGVVEQLNFGSKTALRVEWEAWYFAVEAPRHVRVTNASYGHEKEDHSYLVRIEERDGVPVPAECECPADEYNEEYACKHRVASATVGGPLVLRTALKRSTPTVDTDKPDSKPSKKSIRTDGGVSDEKHDDRTRLIGEERDECRNGSIRCEGPHGDPLPCFACFQLSEDE